MYNNINIFSPRVFYKIKRDIQNTNKVKFSNYNNFKVLIRKNDIYQGNNCETVRITLYPYYLYMDCSEFLKLTYKDFLSKLKYYDRYKYANSIKMKLYSKKWTEELILKYQ